MKLPVNTKPKAHCVVEGCIEARYGNHDRCFEHYMETKPALPNERTYTVAEAYSRWCDETLYTPQLWYGKFKVYGIKKVGLSFSLVLGKHDELVPTREDTPLRLVKGA